MFEGIKTGLGLLAQSTGIYGFINGGWGNLLMILVGFVFLAFCGTAGWILFGEDAWKNLKAMK